MGRHRRAQANEKNGTRMPYGRFIHRPVDSVPSADLRIMAAETTDDTLRTACIVVLQKRHGRDTPIPATRRPAQPPMLMKFGEFKGKPLDVVRLSYLDWLLTQDWIHADLRAAVMLELSRRGPVVAPTPLVRPKQRQRKLKLDVPGHMLHVKLLPPYAAVQPIPADVVLDPMEPCPFDVPDDDPRDELQREYAAIVGR